MPRKLKYGLIGCGGCGTMKHLESYAKNTETVELYAVCDIVPEKAKAAAAKYGIANVYTDYAQMLADKKLDLVSIAVPNALHAPIAIAALQAGKHVHLEKPMAINATEAAAIVKAKDASGKKLMVALNNRFTELSKYARQYIDDGNLGEIYHARCGWRRRRGIPGRGTWFTTKALSGGGPMIDLGVHFFDLTLFFMGFPGPTSVLASTSCNFGHIIDPNAPPPAGTNLLGDPNGIFDVEDLATGFVKLDNGATVAFEFSWASNIEREIIYLELLGTKGGLSMVDGTLKIFSQVAGSQVDITPHVRNTTGWGENETRHFIECITKNLPPLAPPEEAVKMMQIIDAVYASSASGHAVEIMPATA